MRLSPGPDRVDPSPARPETTTGSAPGSPGGLSALLQDSALPAGAIRATRGSPNIAEPGWLRSALEGTLGPRPSFSAAAAPLSGRKPQFRSESGLAVPVEQPSRLSLAAAAELGFDRLARPELPEAGDADYARGAQIGHKTFVGCAQVGTGGREFGRQRWQGRGALLLQDRPFARSGWQATAEPGPHVLI